MFLGNFFLLFGEVAFHIDEFHAVTQRIWDVAQTIRCGNKEDLAQIVVEIEEIVVERIVLFGIQ